MGRIFKVNESTEILCEFVSTRYGFRHDAKLFINGYEQEKAFLILIPKSKIPKGKLLQDENFYDDSYRVEGPIGGPFIVVEIINTKQVEW